MRHSIGVGVAGLMLPEARLTYDPVGRIAMRSSRRGNSTRGRLGCSTRSGRRQTRRAVRCRYQTLQAENRLSHRCEEKNRKSLPNSSGFTENPRCACSGEAAGALSVLLWQRKGGFWSMLARAQYRRSSHSQRRGIFGFLRLRQAVFAQFLLAVAQSGFAINPTTK